MGSKKNITRLNNNINEEWISDKTRFACDGLSKQRIDKPYKRVDGKLVETSWDEIINLISNKLKDTDPTKVAGHIGDMSSLETINCFRTF